MSNLKISICIPQYNRIEYLQINLQHIALQDYSDIEVIVSDDASTDDTADEIAQLQKSYPFPLTYFKFEKNEGYDRNLRKSLELATGDYCFILGNDDALCDSGVITRLANFLTDSNFPDVGFCNSADFIKKDDIQIRAQQTGIIGSGEKVALKFYSSFSFVAGLIFKKSAFNSVNTAKLDGSIYVQIYLATLIIIRGGKLFTIEEPLILKDIRVNNDIANSYLDTLPREKHEFKVLDAGLPSYAHVCALAFKDAGLNSKAYYYKVIRRIYLFTYPFWLFDYRSNNARIAALGLKMGLKLECFRDHEQFQGLSRLKLKFYYHLSTILGLHIPIPIFNSLKKILYKVAKS